MKKYWGILFCLVGLLAACGPTEEQYSRSYCRLYFDNGIRNDPTLAAAMTRHSGVFVTISIVGKQFVFASNQGVSSRCDILAMDERRRYVLGQNNGIIVGYGMSTDAIFYAYDCECPNCFDLNALPRRSYKLAVNEFGIATCGTCKRQYDLNNDGIVRSGSAGKKLTRYRATTTGPYGVLNI